MPSSTRERVGTKNVRVTLEAPAETVTSGEASVPWTTQATVWAQMQGLTGTSRSGIMAEAEYRFTIWYRADLKPQWRIGKVGGLRKFGIISAVDPTGDGVELVILAKELL